MVLFIGSNSRRETGVIRIGSICISEFPIFAFKSNIICEGCSPPPALFCFTCSATMEFNCQYTFSIPIVPPFSEQTGSNSSSKTLTSLVWNKPYLAYFSLKKCFFWPTFQIKLKNVNSMSAVETQQWWSSTVVGLLLGSTMTVNPQAFRTGWEGDTWNKTLALEQCKTFSLNDPLPHRQQCNWSVRLGLKPCYLGIK